MEVFTYEDYIQAIHTFRLHAVMKLAENSEEYKISTKNTNEELIKKILKNTEEIVNFLNDFTELKHKINAKELILCKNKSLDNHKILYKLNNQETFFLICYQPELDNHFPYKLLTICIEIIREWSRNKKTRDIKMYPKVIPIVIYTGNDKWNFPKKIHAKQLEKTTYGENTISLAYNLIDLQKISNKELINKNTMFANILLLEKLQ